MEGVTKRLEALEARTRALARSLGVAGGALAILVILGQAHPSGYPTVDANRFVLHGAGGKIRAALSEAPDGAVALSIYRVTGQLAVIVGLNGDNEPTVELDDRGGKPRCIVGLGDADAPGMDLFDSTRTKRVRVAIGRQGDAVLLLADGSGTVRLSALSKTAGLAAITLNDGKGRLRSALGIDHTDPPSLLMFDQSGSVIFQEPHK